MIWSDLEMRIRWMDRWIDRDWKNLDGDLLGFRFGFLHNHDFNTKVWLNDDWFLEFSKFYKDWSKDFF